MIGSTLSTSTASGPSVRLLFMGTFEGQTQVALGVRGRLPFRAFVLDGPGDGARLVIDVAHKW